MNHVANIHSIKIATFYTLIAHQFYFIRFSDDSIILSIPLKKPPSLKYHAKTLTIIFYSTDLFFQTEFTERGQVKNQNIKITVRGSLRFPLWFHLANQR